MTFVQFLLLFFAIAGVSFTITHSKIMDILKLRQLWSKSPFLKELFQCSFCNSFHIGYTYGILCYLLTKNYEQWFYIMTIPFAASAFVFFWDRIVIMLDNITIKQEKKSVDE